MLSGDQDAGVGVLVAPDEFGEAEPLQVTSHLAEG
jgi:hypothetical protein